MMEGKTFNVHFTPQKISPKTTLSSVVTLSLAHFRKTFFPLLASALNAYRMDGFDLSLLIISPRFCLAQLKKNPVLLTSMLLTDCHLMLVFLSLPVPLQCFYVTKDTLFLAFWLLIVYSCALFSIYFDWTWIERRGSRRKAINIHVKCALHWKFTTKPIKKTFRISLKHSNIHLSFLFLTNIWFFCIQVCAHFQPQMPPIDSFFWFSFFFASLI